MVNYPRVAGGFSPRSIHCSCGLGPQLPPQSRFVFAGCAQYKRPRTSQIYEGGQPDPARTTPVTRELPHGAESRNTGRRNSFGTGREAHEGLSRELNDRVDLVAMLFPESVGEDLHAESDPRIRQDRVQLPR